MALMAMITPAAPGHTGRPLRAGRAETMMYLLMQIGVACRLMAGAARLNHATPGCRFQRPAGVRLS